MEFRAHWRAVGFLVVLLTVLSGCTQPDRSEGGNQEAGFSDLELTPVLDERSGAVTLPYERFSSVGFTDIDLILSASTVEAAVCARKQGVKWLALAPSEDPVYESEHFFGPWTLEQARNFGFVPPMPDADLRANEFVPEDYGEPAPAQDRVQTKANALLNDEQLAIVADCSERARETFDPDVLDPPSPWRSEMRAIQESIVTDPEVVPVWKELGECYEERGLSQDRELPWLVADVDLNTLDEEQTALAVASVECKRQVDATRRIAEIWAERQAFVLDKYAVDIAKQGQRWEETRAAAEELIRQHPEVFVE